MKQEPTLAFRLKSLDNQIRRQLERTAILENPANLTGMQYALLGFISNRIDHMDIYQRDIEAEFNIRRSTASVMVKQLERAGLIRRESVPNDARLKKIILTEKADAPQKASKRNMERLQALLTRGLSPEELKNFNATLDKIQKNLVE